jgi:molybdopterin synthase sulfur carrier subunit
VSVPAGPPHERATLTVRYFAGARAAAGVPEEAVPAPVTLDALLGLLAGRHGADLGRVLKACSYLVDGLAWHDHGAEIPAGSTVDVLPPFAGG